MVVEHNLEGVGIAAGQHVLELRAAEVAGRRKPRKAQSQKVFHRQLVSRIERVVANYLPPVKLPRDFQLTSFRAARREVIDRVCEMGGVYPYITSMLFANAARYANVPVRHDPRTFGASNYSLKRSFVLAANLILSYSPLPLYMIGGLCLGSFLFALLFGTVILIRALTSGISVPGWASTVIFISFFNSLQLLCIMIISLYLSRLHQQMTRTKVSYAIAEIDD
jgi:hypothetical protein